MARTSPILPLHERAEAFIAPYGAADQPGSVRVVETFGELELEYAALRKHCALFDWPQRGVVEVQGPDRIEFLNRMVTQELKGVEPFSVRRSFWLNRKGRIDADLRVIVLPERVLLECDIHAVKRTVETLSSYIVMEECSVRDVSEETHRLALHGPNAAAVLAEIVVASAAGLPSIASLVEGQACLARVGDSGSNEIVVYREDSAGETGVEMIMPTAQAAPIYMAIIERFGMHDGHEGHLEKRRQEDSKKRGGMEVIASPKVRPAGWHAFNIARIEAGTPVYLIDFGPDSLPAETGVLLDRVNFKKGCYLGQEIVARMNARGHPKQQLVGIRFEVDEAMRDPQTGLPPQPVTGTVLSLAGGGAEVGVVTSATLAPMLSSSPIAFAQAKWDHIAPGTKVECRTDRGTIAGAIQDGLKFWRK